MSVPLILRRALGCLYGLMLSACAGGPTPSSLSTYEMVDAGPPSRGRTAPDDLERRDAPATTHAAPPAVPTRPAAVSRDVLEQPALDFVCVGTIDALDALTEAETALGLLASQQGVTLGTLRFVRFDSDPAARPRRTQPRLCASVVEAHLVYAPLFREREISASWLIERGFTTPDASAGELVARLANRAATAGWRPLGPVRALVEDGAFVGLALPVTTSADR